MPFGLQNAPPTFQRLVDCILGELNEFTNVYIDDISVFSANWDDHLKHLDLVLTCLKEGLTIQAAESQLGMNTCKFLGHVMGKNGITPQQTKTRAVEEFRQPLNKSNVRVFLGLVGYYRKFIPAFSSTAAPLTDPTKKSYPDIVNWMPECEQSFTKLKQLQCSQPVLRAPDYNIPFTLQTDASKQGIGAVLAQRDSAGTEHPIAYYSRKMFPRECRYSATEQEGVAGVEACKYFLPYLLGRSFRVVTDHRALNFLAQKESSNGRLARWMDVSGNLPSPSSIAQENQIKMLTPSLAKHGSMIDQLKTPQMSGRC